MVWTHNINPVLVHLGPLQIRWYGVMYVLGFIFTYWYVHRRIKAGNAPINKDQLESSMIWMVIGMLIGARLGEIFIYRSGYYLANPIKMIAIWEGGLSFHGALIGMVIAVLIWCKRYDKKFLEIADTFIIPIVLANAFGRIGNFINGELFGKLTTLPWGVKFPFAEGFRHPSQLYEAAYNVLIFGVLHVNRDKKWKAGTIFAWFLVLYGALRFLTGFIRIQDYYVGLLGIGQILNIGVFIAGLLLFWHIRKN